MEIDFYSILNVTRNATEEEISKSYKKLALKYHPDKNNANPEIIKQLNRAKEILLDAEKRSEYDENYERLETDDNEDNEAYNDGRLRIEDQNASFKIIIETYRSLIQMWRRIGSLGSLDDNADFENEYAEIMSQALTDPNLLPYSDSLSTLLEECKHGKHLAYADLKKELLPRELIRSTMQTSMRKCLKSEVFNKSYRTLSSIYSELKSFLNLSDLFLTTTTEIDQDVRSCLLSNFHLRVGVKQSRTNLSYTSNKVPILDVNTIRERSTLEKLALLLDSRRKKLDFAIMSDQTLRHLVLNRLPRYENSCLVKDRKSSPLVGVSCEACGRSNNGGASLLCCASCEHTFCDRCVSKIRLPSVPAFVTASVCDMCYLERKEGEKSIWLRQSIKAFNSNRIIEGLVAWRVACLLDVDSHNSLHQSLLAKVVNDLVNVQTRISFVFYVLLNEAKENCDVPDYLGLLAGWLKEIGKAKTQVGDFELAFMAYRGAWRLYTMVNKNQKGETVSKEINNLVFIFDQLEDKMRKKVEDELNVLSGSIYSANFETLAVKFLTFPLNAPKRLALKKYFSKKDNMPEYMELDERKSMFLYARGVWRVFDQAIEQDETLNKGFDDLEQAMWRGWLHHEHLMESYANIMATAYATSNFMLPDEYLLDRHEAETMVLEPASRHMWIDMLKNKKLFKHIKVFENRLRAKHTDKPIYEDVILAYISLIGACDRFVEKVFSYLYAAIWSAKAFEATESYAEKIAMSMMAYSCVENVVLSLYRSGEWDMLSYALRLAYTITSRTLMLASQAEICLLYAKLFAFRSPFSPAHRYAPISSVAESCILDAKFDQVREAFMTRIAINDRIDSLLLPFRPELVAYYSFEQYWRNGGYRKVDAQKYEFEIKAKAMDSLLETHGIDADTVKREYLEYELVNRDENGWVHAGHLLNIADEEFSLYTLRGIRIDKKSGLIEFIDDREDYCATPLLTPQDVALVLANSGRGADQFPQSFFSLDAVDESHFDMHPFQRFRYSPSCMRGTQMLATMFHTDYLMKQMSIGCEISSQPPFENRSVCAALYEGFSPEMRWAFRSTVEREQERDQEHNVKSRIHRFWIQADEMSYNIDENDNKVTYWFGEVKMSVKCRAQTVKRDGESTDEVGIDKDDAEHQFANDFTLNYDRLAREHYPEFLRLKELCKLQYVWTFLNSYLENLKSMLKKQISEEQIREAREKMAEKLREICSKLKSELAKAGSQQIDASVIDQLRQVFVKYQHDLLNFSRDEISASVVNQWIRGSLKDESLIKDWILPNEHEFRLYIESCVYGEFFEEVTRRKCSFEQQFADLVEKSHEILAKTTNLDRDQNVEEWVPAVFRRLDEGSLTSVRMVYGGVSLQPRLVLNENLRINNNGRSNDMIKADSILSSIFPNNRNNQNNNGDESKSVKTLAKQCCYLRDITCHLRVFDDCRIVCKYASTSEYDYLTYLFKKDMLRRKGKPNRNVKNVPHREFVEYAKSGEANYFPNSFSGGSYYVMQTPPRGMKLYRFYGDESNKKGCYWTAERPTFKQGCYRDKNDYAILNEFGNPMTNLIEIDVPEGVVMFVGIASPQKGKSESFLGGGVQVFLPYDVMSLLVDANQGGNVEVVRDQVLDTQKKSIRDFNKCVKHEEKKTRNKRRAN